MPPAASSVGFVGFGLVGRAAFEALAATGVRAFHVADEMGHSSSGGGHRNHVRGDACVRIHPYLAPGQDWYGSWLQGCALCLLCADRVDPAVALEVNARCLEYRVPLLAGLVMGTVAQVGPVTAPGTSACLQCVDLRLQAVTGRSCLAPFAAGPPQLARRVGAELAARAGRVLDGTGDDLQRCLSYYWSDGSVRHHPVLRTWHCSQCADLGSRASFCWPKQLGTEDADGTEASYILRQADRLIDPVTGPVRSLERFEPTDGDPAIRHWVAALADPGWASFGRSTVYCGGNNLDDDRARAAALGEAVERMSVCQPAPAEVLVAAYRDVERDAVDPRRWDLFASKTRAEPGFPYVAVSPRDPISWIWGWSLTAGRPALVPASRVFVPFRAQAPADNADYPALSGSAAAGRWEEAVLNGLLEVAERDAFMIAWANRLELPRLIVDRSSPGGVGAYVGAFEDAGVEVRCVTVTLDLGVAVVIAMAGSRGSGDPAMVVGCGAALEPASACRHALAELAANRLNVRHTMSTATRLPECDPNDVRDETAHGLLYARPEMAAHLRHWWDSSPTVSLSAPTSLTVAHQLRRLVAGVADAGLDALVVDVTPPEIRDLGLWVAKALVPGAYPMNFDSAWPHLGGSRLRAAPVAAGLLDSAVPFLALNRVPHPFP